MDKLSVGLRLERRLSMAPKIGGNCGKRSAWRSGLWGSSSIVLITPLSILFSG